MLSFTMLTIFYCTRIKTSRFSERARNCSGGTFVLYALGDDREGKRRADFIVWESPKEAMYKPIDQITRLLFPRRISII